MVADKDLDEICGMFRDQAKILADAGVDLIVLETFRLLSEMRIAIDAVREVCDLPIIAQMAFDAEGRTADGADPVRAVTLLKRWGRRTRANCVEGPDATFRAVSQMLGHGIPISAQPNAGYPRMQDGRLIYMATPEYFGVFARRFFKAGVAIVGGCCGTNPEHVKRIANARRMLGAGGPEDLEVVADQRRADGRSEGPRAGAVRRAHPAREQDRSRLPRARRARSETAAVAGQLRRLGRGQPWPPGSIGAPPSRPRACSAPAASTSSTSPTGRAPRCACRTRRSPRLSSASSTWRSSSTVPAAATGTCSGSSPISSRPTSAILTTSSSSPVTRPKLGDYPHATAVFDLDSIGLLRLVNGLNRGIDPAGKAFGATTRFVCSCGAEPAALDYDRELRRLEEEARRRRADHDPAGLRPGRAQPLP